MPVIKTTLFIAENMHMHNSWYIHKLIFKVCIPFFENILQSYTFLKGYVLIENQCLTNMLIN